MVRAENQRLHTELGNSESEKELLKQELVELRSQLKTERADRKEIETELSPAKAKFCSGRQTFREINTRRRHNSQPTPSQTQKIPGVTCRHRGNFRDYGGVLREHIPRTLGINPGAFRGFPEQNLNNCRLTKSPGTCDRK